MVEPLAEVTRGPARVVASATKAGRRYLRWRARKASLRLRRAVASRLYQDRDPDVGRAILVAGTARSGTTWLADVIASQLACRILFEPFNNRLVTDYRAYNYFQYMRPEEGDERLEAFCGQVFSGAIRHPWIDRHADRLRPRCRLIKEIRANLMLKWVRVRFPQMPIVFLVRHPCAVVWSRMQLGWAPEMDMEPLLAQPKLVDDFLGDYLDVVQRARSDVEQNAVIWCISNLVPLRQLGPDEAHVIFYERLITQPEREMPMLFNALGRPYHDSVFAGLDRPSTTSRHESAAVTGADRLNGWQEKLTAKEVDIILGIVEAFGLDGLYGDSPLPRPDWRAGRQQESVSEQ